MGTSLLDIPRCCLRKSFSYITCWRNIFSGLQKGRLDRQFFSHGSLRAFGWTRIVLKRMIFFSKCSSFSHKIQVAKGRTNNKVEGKMSKKMNMFQNVSLKMSFSQYVPLVSQKVPVSSQKDHFSFLIKSQQFSKYPCPTKKRAKQTK